MALSSYVLFRVREHMRRGGTAAEIARVAKVSPSLITQLQQGVGVSSGSVDGYARFFGFPDGISLRMAAQEWFAGGGSETEEATTQRRSEPPAAKPGEEMNRLYLVMDLGRADGLPEAFLLDWERQVGGHVDERTLGLELADELRAAWRAHERQAKAGERVGRPTGGRKRPKRKKTP